jgi:hypothetical protein
VSIVETFTMDLYANMRANVEGAVSERVEVNQRALIDKILARYASAGAVYRELIQNSNDAEADTAEVYFTTEKGIVTQVLYRNNGMPFRGQDWSRLKKIAEGNPDVSKVGAFGVGAYTMFSICEEPLVLSGDEALAFVWKGDALFTKTAPNKAGNSEWTSFVLPSRDPYPLPDIAEFASFLVASLTFTQCLCNLKVFVDKKERVEIIKTLLQEPRPVSTPQATSWWKRNEVVTTTSQGVFSLPQKAILESIYRIQVKLDGETASLDARFISASATTNIPLDMARRMERVTKKKPPAEVKVQLFLNAQRIEKARNDAERVTQSFSPRPGAGRIFIGFRTSQTTGLAAHVSAPFVPTVEREAMDLQDLTLRTFNMELLEFSGILMRLTLEDTMYSVIDVKWKNKTAEREKLEKEYASKKHVEDPAKPQSAEEVKPAAPEKESGGGGLMGFARFMAKGVTQRIVSVVEDLVSDSSEYLNPVDRMPLFQEEEEAVVLMQSFCPQQSTPDALVGTCIAQGFARSLPNTAPPVLTRSGVVRSDEARLPSHGIETFVKDNVVRSVVFKNAEEYHKVIASCRPLEMRDMLPAIQAEVLEEDRLIFLLKWWTKFSRVDPHAARDNGRILKEVIRFYPCSEQGKPDEERKIVALEDVLFYVEKESLIARKSLPLPETVVDLKLQEKIGESTFTDASLKRWFTSLPMEIWAGFISHDRSMTEGRPEDAQTRLQVLTTLYKEYQWRSHAERSVFGSFLGSILGDKRCIPFDTEDKTVTCVADLPSDLYLPSAELKAFDGVGYFRKVSKSLVQKGITDEFLLELGVRKSVSIDFLFSSLDKLKWTSDPKPLVEYLRSATLTNVDIAKLSRSQYLPAEKDDSRNYAPPELYLPNGALRIFPFVKMLLWPSESDLSERSLNGTFLVSKLGMKTKPPLVEILSYIAKEVKDESLRLQCLDFLADRLGPHGIYNGEYSQMNTNTRRRFRILPCSTIDLLEKDGNLLDTRSPASCYAFAGCAIMGFPVVDPSLKERSKLYGSLFQCPHQPRANDLLDQLLLLVEKGKRIQRARAKEGGNAVDVSDRIECAFTAIFDYLSHRASDFGFSALNTLKRESFIPCKVGDQIEWLGPDQVFFKRSKGGNDELTQDLFRVVEFSPFLAAAGGESSQSFSLCAFSSSRSYTNLFVRFPSETGSLY